MKIALFSSPRRSQRFAVCSLFVAAVIGLFLATFFPVKPPARASIAVMKPSRFPTAPLKIMAQKIGAFEYSIDGGSHWRTVHGVLSIRQHSEVDFRILPESADAFWSEKTPLNWIKDGMSDDSASDFQGSDFHVLYSEPCNSLQILRVQYGKQTRVARFRVISQYELSINNDVPAHPILPGGGRNGCIWVNAALRDPDGATVPDIPVHFSLVDLKGQVMATFTDATGQAKSTITTKQNGTAVAQLHTADKVGDCCIVATAHIGKQRIIAKHPFFVDPPQGMLQIGTWASLPDGEQRAHYQAKIYVNVQPPEKFRIAHYPVSVHLPLRKDTVLSSKSVRIVPARDRTDSQGILDGYIYYDASTPGASKVPPCLALTLHDNLTQRDFSRQ